MAVLIAAAWAMAAPARERALRIEQASIDELRIAMEAGRLSSADIVRANLARIGAMDRRGPASHSVIAINPDAIVQARALDAERRAGHVRGPLHGIPVLVKDNIETADPVATTAGSLALANNVTRVDAPLVARLRHAGAIILGKTNMSEWANFRSNRSMSGWSAVGGLVRNPHALDRTACGSSSGSAAAVSAGFAVAAIGTETDGSIVCPSSMTGVVGLKPTVGLVSRSRVVPISFSQDTPGPIARSVRDAALLLSAMQGADPSDVATAGTVPHDYAAELTPSALSGTRIAVVRPDDLPTALAARFDAALATLRADGAILVPVAAPRHEGLADAERTVLQTEFEIGINAYLAAAPAAVAVRSLDALIAFDAANATTEMPFFGQETFAAAARSGGLADPVYLAARRAAQRAARADGIDAMLEAADASLLVQPTYGTAWLSDPVNGDQYDGPSASQLPAIAGYPHLTVPMGSVRGLPVGLSFIATRGGDGLVLAAGAAYEARSQARTAPRFPPSVDAGIDVGDTRRRVADRR